MSKKDLFSIKNEGNNRTVEKKVSGRCREGFIVPIRWHPLNNLNENDNLHSIHYV